MSSRYNTRLRSRTPALQLTLPFRPPSSPQNSSPEASLGPDKETVGADSYGTWGRAFEDIPTDEDERQRQPRNARLSNSEALAMDERWRRVYQDSSTDEGWRRAHRQRQPRDVRSSEDEALAVDGRGLEPLSPGDDLEPQPPGSPDEGSQ